MDGGEAGLVIAKRAAAAALLVLASSCATVTRQESVPPLWAGLERGSSHVGFRTVGASNVWYPASTGGEALRLRDYAGALDDVEAALHGKHFSDRGIDDLLDMRMLARRDAQAVDVKPQPVVTIILNDGESPAGHAVLGEFLASHGYVVIAAPANAKIDAVPGGKSSLFLHNVDVTTWTFLSSPAVAKQKAEQLLAFVAKHFAR